MRSSILTQKRAKALRRSPTRPEQSLWSLLRHNQLGLHFRRQHAEGPFILDVFCAAKRQPSFHNVIPAQAGIQAEPSDVREPGLDSRLRGNDDVGNRQAAAASTG
jgi:hypothetical protein